jgi:hypothetical protein
MTDVRGDTYLNPRWTEELRNVGAINKIIVHHDAAIRPHDYDSMARYRSEAAAHYNRLGPGLQYHFKIDNVGEIFWIRPFEQALYHAGNYPVNRQSIAICVDGYFHPDVNQNPTREQYEALKQLLDWLCTQNPQFPASQGDVFGHREVSQSYTACPGDILLPFVQNYRTSGGNPIIPNVPYDWASLQPATPAPKPAETPTIPSVVTRYKVFKDGKQIGAYTQEANAWSKYLAENGQLITDNGVDVTSQFTAKYITAAPSNPVKPPTIDPADTTNLNNKPIVVEPIIKDNIFVRILKFLVKLFKK